jgi:hypothetical protein
MTYVPGNKQPADALSRIVENETKASVFGDNAPSVVDNCMSSADRSGRQAEKVGELIEDVRFRNNYSNHINLNVLEVGPNLDTEWPELVGRFLVGDSSWSNGISNDLKSKVLRQAHRFKFFHDILHVKVPHNGSDILVPY